MEARRSKRIRSCVQPANDQSDMSAAMELPTVPDRPANASNHDSPVIAVCTDHNLIKFIFQQLEISDLCAAASVCRLWNEVSNSEDFWSEVSFKNKNVLPNQVAAVLSRHRCIHKLDLSGLKCGLNDNALFRRIAPCLQQLRELHFSNTPGSERRVSEKVISVISESLPSLRTLDLQGVMLQGPASACILNHAGLETLRLKACDSFAVMLRCRGLQRLSLAESQVMRLPDLTGCPALVELDVRGCKKMQDLTIRSALPGLASLRALQLGRGVPITDETLREMATVLSSLTQLVLAETPGMTLTNVRGFPSLRVLDLSRVESLTPASLQAAVESFTALEQLLLDNCHTLATLKLNMPHLREISLRGCGSLVDLDLNCWRLAVLGLGPLSRGAPGNSTLQRLAVTSGALKKMEWIQCRKLSQLELNCPYLTELVIRDCDNITPAAVEALGDKGPPPVAAAGLVPGAAGSGGSLGSRGLSSGAGLGLGRLDIGADAEQGGAGQRFAAAMWQDHAVADDGVDGGFSPGFEAAGIPADADEVADAGSDGADDDDNDDDMMNPPAAAAAVGSAGLGRGRLGSWAWSAQTGSAVHRWEAATRAGASRARTAAAASPAQQPAERPNTRSRAAAAVSCAATAVRGDVCRSRMRDWHTWLGSDRPGSSAAAAAAGPGPGHACSSQAHPSGAAGSHCLSGVDADMDVDNILESPRQQTAAGQQQQEPAAGAPMTHTAVWPSRIDELLAAADDSEPDQDFDDERSEGPEGSRRMRRRRSMRRESQSQAAPSQQQPQPIISNDAPGGSSSGRSGGLLSMLPSLRMPGWRGFADAPAAAEADGPSSRGLGSRGGLTSHGLLGLHLMPGELRPSRAVGAQRGQASAAQAGASSANASTAAAASIPMVVSLVGERAGSGAAGSRGAGGGPTPPPISPPPQQPSGGRGGVPELRTLRVEGCDGLKRLSLKHSGLQALSVVGCRSLSTLVVEAPQLGRLELDEVGELQGISLQKVGLPSLALGGCSGLSGLELVSNAIKRLDLRGCGQLEQLLLDCPALAVMDATFCSGLGDAGLASAVAKAPPLTQLVLSVCCQIGSFGLLSLSSLSTLQQLDLSYTEVTSLVPVFSSCPRLKTLSLSSCRSLKRDALAPLLSAGNPTLPELTSLDASYCDLEESILARLLSSCSRLKHLALNGCSSVTDQLWQQLEQAQLHRLQHHPAVAMRPSAAGAPMDTDGAVAHDVTVDCSSSSSSNLESLSLVKCSNLKSLCLGLLPASGQVDVLQPKHYLLSGDREALHARSAGYSWQEVPSAVSSLTSLRLGLSAVQVVALALPKLEHLDLSSCGYLRVLELQCPLLLTLHLQACRSLPMYNMAQAAVRCPQLEKLDVQHMFPAQLAKQSNSDAVGSADGSSRVKEGSILTAAVNAAPGVSGAKGGAVQLHQLLDDLASGHPSLQRVLRCPINCGVCARATGTTVM